MATQFLNDPNTQVLFTLPDTGATIDVNTLPEGKIDELIRIYGGHGPLLGRKNFFEQQKANQNSEALAGDELQKQVLARTEAELQKKLGSIFGQVEQAGAASIDRQFAPARSKLIAEEAALGRLRSPVSRAGLNQLDERKDYAMNQLFGNIAGQRASGQMDFAKTIEAILGGERRAKEQVDQFGQSLGLRRDMFQNDIRQAGEDRALQRYMFDSGNAQRRDMMEEDEFDKHMRRVGAGIDMGGKTVDVFSSIFGKGNKGGLAR